MGKFLSNSCFGRFIMNPLKRKNIQIITKQKDMLNAVRKPNFIDRIILNESLAVVTLHRASVYYDKLPLVGVQILELSKIDFFSFFYLGLKAQFGDRVKAIINDTDSHLVENQSDNVSEELKQLQHWLDCSNLNHSDPLYIA